MHFQGRRKIQLSTSLHNVVPVPVVWILHLAADEQRCSKRKFDRNRFGFSEIFRFGWLFSHCFRFGWFQCH